ncbi:MAG: HIT domain-containing protein, partial [bacterium]|nr:HIT domain-containing protein [bacterium]
RIIAKEIPSTVVFEDENILAIRDIAPVAPIHILIMPKRHIPRLDSSVEMRELSDIHRAINRLAEQYSLTESGFRVVVNVGHDGGQSVDHLHFHLIGGRGLDWPPG